MSAKPVISMVSRDGKNNFIPNFSGTMRVFGLWINQNSKIHPKITKRAKKGLKRLKMHENSTSLVYNNS